MTGPSAGLGWLRGAQLLSVYQPIVDRSGVPVGFEALVRATRAGLSMSPAWLFSDAHEQGAERLLDRRAAQSAVQGAAGWLGTRLLFVNVAPVSLLSAATWLDALLGHLEDAQIDPGQVVVELNEEQRITGDPALVRLLDEARSSGLQLALDDVLGDDLTEEGCRAIRPEYVKVDGSVVADLGEPGGLLPLERVLRVAGEVGATVIAEQVESRAQLDLLHSCGVELAQGWLVGRPGPGRAPAPPAQPQLRLVPSPL